MQFVVVVTQCTLLSCTQAVTRNVWGRILQRLKSIATFDIWKRVFEFNNQFSVQGRGNIEQHVLFHLPPFFLHIAPMHVALSDFIMYY